MLNDVFILTQIKEGNIKAFETLFRQYYTPLRLYAASITGEPDVAEEIVEELFYVFWKDREKLEIFHSVKNYLYRSVRNRSIQYCEHQDVKRRYQDAILSVPVNIASPDPQEQIEYKELQQIINRTLEKLPERRLHIFRLHHTEGKKYSEIASLLSLSVKTVEKEMTRALRTLRKKLRIISRYHESNRKKQDPNRSGVEQITQSPGDRRTVTNGDRTSFCHTSDRMDRHSSHCSYYKPMCLPAYGVTDRPPAFRR